MMTSYEDIKNLVGFFVAVSQDYLEWLASPAGTGIAARVRS